MIAVSSSGSSFRALAAYLASGRSGEERGRVAWSAARNLPTNEPELAAKFMRATAAQSSRVEKPVYHVVLSFDPADGVDRAKMERVADRVLDRLGLAGNQAVIVAHRDREHAHVHLLVNRVHPETSRVGAVEAPAAHPAGLCEEENALGFMSMTDTDSPDIDDAERYRTRLFGIAYRMLSDAQEAEDLVQETFLRWHQARHDDVISAEGWLVAVITRLAIDRLRRAETERLRYVVTRLPEPIATGDVPPDHRAELASDLSMAFLVLLERLGPEERAAFLLREVFDAGYDEIARILDKTEPAVRQTVHRAKTRVREGRPRFAPPAEQQEALLRRFLDALATDDKDAMLAMFAPDATFTGDGGGKVSSITNVLVGPDRITRFLLGIERKYPGVFTHEIIELNGQPAIGSYRDGVIRLATSFETDGERILAIYRVLNPDKLAHLR